jgi:heme exporter protein C
MGRRRSAAGGWKLSEENAMSELTLPLSAEAVAPPGELRVRSSVAPITVVLIGVTLLAAGSWFGLFVAPAEYYMGETQRIMYVHVPTAWTAMLALTWAAICAGMYLFRGSWKWDSRMEAAVEIGVLLSALLCMQGAIWAKPTWGVWWDWDPRLTTTAVLLFAFLGIVVLRKFVEDPVKRATWSASAVVIAYVDVPIVYFSVKWWNSLHQSQSTVSTVSGIFQIPLFLNAVGMLFLAIGLMWLRSRTAAARLSDELAPPLPLPTEGGAR